VLPHKTHNGRTSKPTQERSRSNRSGPGRREEPNGRDNHLHSTNHRQHPNLRSLPKMGSGEQSDWLDRNFVLGSTVCENEKAKNAGWRRVFLGPNNRGPSFSFCSSASKRDERSSRRRRSYTRHGNRSSFEFCALIIHVLIDFVHVAVWYALMNRYECVYRYSYSYRYRGRHGHRCIEL
jgi:hypothetical protein